MIKQKSYLFRMGPMTDKVDGFIHSVSLLFFSTLAICF